MAGRNAYQTHHVVLLKSQQLSTVNYWTKKSKKMVSRMVQRAYMMVVRDWKSPGRGCSMYLGKSNYVHKVIESDIEG